MAAQARLLASIGPEVPAAMMVVGIAAGPVAARSQAHQCGNVLACSLPMPYSTVPMSTTATASVSRGEADAEGDPLARSRCPVGAAGWP